VRQAYDACRMITDDETKIRSIMQTVLKKLSVSDMTDTPPKIGQYMHRIIREELQNPDPYRELKRLSTKKALELVPSALHMIQSAQDPFSAAVRFAIAGNILDFGIKTNWDEKRVLKSFYMALDKTIHNDKTPELFSAVEKAKTILFLADNAGESVFDRILISTFPGSPEVFYAVKGSPVINDATEQDALEAGVDGVARIISNGTDIGGTIVAESSEEFQKLYNRADVVIAKGQGNFETLNEETREIFFLLQIKCENLATRYGFSFDDWIVTDTASILKR
jgi:uncharacterized protein with ATP-grasp and redox domains